MNWRPWGDAAFEEARERDVPVLLSVGYSACHWCHVMAHESFEDPQMAERINANFVPVKVDREERPDVDALYMEAVQAMTGHGGWPLTVFLTPQGEPFYGGTYYPPTARGGMPGFDQILDSVSDAWNSRRVQVQVGADRLTQALGQSVQVTADAAAPFDAGLLQAAEEQLVSHSDPRYGGLGGAPKFPQAPALGFLACQAARGSEAAGDVVLRSLAGMVQGGLFDQLAGGFHRYAVDATWTVPHFEKMLYDNALLLGLCVEGWQLSREARLHQAALATAEFLLGSMRSPEGVFWAAIDADSEGEEGAYYVWTPERVDAVLNGPDARLARAWYGITEAGNFDGHTVLTARRDLDAAAEEAGLPTEEAAQRLPEIRRALLASRAQRPAPAVDRKIVTAWNGLAVDALARAGFALNRPGLIGAASEAAAFLRDTVTVDGGPAHMWAEGRGHLPAFLDDVGGLASAAVTLYETTFDPGWLEWAASLAERLVAEFADDEGRLYRTGTRHADLLVRQQDLTDAPTPSGTALAANALLRLGYMTGEGAWIQAGEAALRGQVPIMDRAPSAAGAGLRLASHAVHGWREVAVVGPMNAPELHGLVDVLRAELQPGLVRAVGEPDADEPALLRGRGLVDGAPAAYVCRGHVCDVPVTDAEQLADDLGHTWIAGMGLPLDPAWPAATPAAS